MTLSLIDSTYLKGTHLNIIIPAYKPDKRLLGLVGDLKEVMECDIVVVDDGSGEEYWEIFDAIPSFCTLLRHDCNKGKGRAVKTALEYIAKTFPDSNGVVIVDADGQHLPKDVKLVCDKLDENPSSLILGVRKFTGHVPFRSRFGNSLTRLVFTAASGIRVSDTQTGLRAFSLEHIPEFLKLEGERYEYEMNMLMRAAELKIKINEVDIETVYLENNQSSHFHVIRDSLRIYAVILKYVMASVISFVIDFALLFVLKTYVFVGIADQALGLFLSVVGARVVSSLVNYTLNRKIVFKNTSGVKATIFKYYCLVAGIMLANFAMLSLLSNVMGLFYAKVITEVALYIVSYTMQRLFIFKAR